MRDFKIEVDKMGSHIGQCIKHHVLFLLKYLEGSAFGFCCLWVFCSLVFCVCVIFFLNVFIELQWWKLVWYVVWHFWIVTVCLTKDRQSTCIWMVLTDCHIYVSTDNFVLLTYLTKDWTELINLTEKCWTACLIIFEIFLFCP